MDRISLLPDDILGHILSFLPTKQAASTSLLSKRWRNVFFLVTILDLHYDDRIVFLEAYRSLNSTYNFDNMLKAQRSLYDNGRKFMDFVDSLLSRQGKSLIKKLTLKIYGSCLDQTCVQNWICNVLERDVVDLNMDLNLFDEEKNQLVSPLIFKNNTLVKLTLGGGFTINLSYLPKLKTLCLYSVDFGGVHDDVFETLLSCCPVLEELVFENRLSEKGHSSVSSRSLKKLIIRFFNTQTISLNVPNLVYLELSCIFGVKYATVNLDSLVEARLNLIASESRLQEQRQGSAHLIPADTIDIIIQMRNVKVLHLTTVALEMFYFSGHKLPNFDNLVRLCISSDKTQGWQILPLLIKNSPNLETLIFEHYKTTNCGDVCACLGSKEKNRLACLSTCRVKVLEIWGYKGGSKELNQMKHFLKELPCLELVKIKVVNNLKVPIRIHQLLTLPRASPNCKIQAIS